MIRSFVNKIKATKKVANEKNVHNWFNCVYQSIFIIFATSIILSLYTISYFTTDDTSLQEVQQYALLLPLGYTLLLSYFLLEKLILLHIWAFSKLNKKIFELWQKMDMYWFRKYRKHSPVTEGLSKLQNKASKINSSKRKRRIVTIAVIVGLVAIQIGFRVPYMLEAIEEPEPILTPEEIQQITDMTPQELEEYKAMYEAAQQEEQQNRVKVNIGR